MDAQDMFDSFQVADAPSRHASKKKALKYGKLAVAKKPAAKPKSKTSAEKSAALTNSVVKTPRLQKKGVDS
eukprot:4086652-Amphidinium_carterae.1